MQVCSIDDDPVNQNVVRSMLSSTGYEVGGLAWAAFCCCIAPHRCAILTAGAWLQAMDIPVTLLPPAQHTQVITFPDGPSALEHLRTCDALPDVVLLDCMMPVMDGWVANMRRKTYMHAHCHPHCSSQGPCSCHCDRA